MSMVWYFIYLFQSLNVHGMVFHLCISPIYLVPVIWEDSTPQLEKNASPVSFISSGHSTDNEEPEVI